MEGQFVTQSVCGMELNAMKTNKGRRFFIKMTHIIIVIALICAFLTGVLMHPLEEMMLIKILHKLASALLMLGVVVHVIQHNNKYNND